jgi:predicted RNase H-like nuclease (RuvC/YqgF family)
MELEEVLKKLSDDEKSVVSAAIEAEKKRGIDEYRKVSSNNKNLLSERNKFKDALKALEIDPEAEELSDRIDALKERLSGKQSNAEQAKLQRQIKELTDWKQNLENEKKALSEKLSTKTASDALRYLIGDKVQASQYVINDLIRSGRVRVLEDDSVMWVGQDGDVPLKDGAEKFLKENPDIVKNPIAPGSGSKDEKGTNKKSMTKADWLKLPPKEQGAFITGGGTLQ